MEQKVTRTKRTKSPQQALQSLMRLCARSEHSSGDALRLMKRWGVEDGEAQKVVARLENERFIDDTRYAEAFVRDKLNLSGWGAYKIKSSLRAKGISREIIEEVIAPMIDAVNMSERLEEIMLRKMRTLKYKSSYDAKTKLIRFAASRGYNMDEAVECASKICGKIEDVYNFDNII